MPEDANKKAVPYLPDTLPGTAKYARISNVFRSRIISGSWPVGFQIPTIDQLSKDYNVARITIRQAINRLVVEGLVKSERGRGTFVISSSPRGDVDLEAIEASDGLSEFGATGRIKVLSRDNDVEIPALLRRGRRAAGKYLRIRKTNSKSNKVLFLMDFYVQPHLYDRYVSGEEMKSPIQNILKPYFFDNDIMVDTLVHIIFTDNTLSDILGCEVSSQSAELIRTFYDLDGSIVAASSSIYQPGLFRYKTTQTVREYFRSRFPSSTAIQK